MSILPYQKELNMWKTKYKYFQLPNATKSQILQATETNSLYGKNNNNKSNKILTKKKKIKLYPNPTLHIQESKQFPDTHFAIVLSF